MAKERSTAGKSVGKSVGDTSSATTDAGTDAATDKEERSASGEIPEGPVALVLTGDGARSAYEAGALSVLLPLLEDQDAPRIILGTSAGGLNAALVASVIDQGLDVAATTLLDAWRTITPEKVFTRPRAGMARFLAWHLRHAPATAPGLLDTTPLRATIEEMLRPHEFGHNVDRGHLDALGMVASSCSTAEAVCFVQGRMPPLSGERIRYLPVTLSISHLLASSAFPLAFPAQWVEGPGPGGGDWYVDGGIHLNAPLKPAIDLGAGRLLVLGATDERPFVEPRSDLPPNIGDGGGQILHAVLTDRLQADLAHLRRTNQFVRELDGRGRAPAAGSGHRLIATCVMTPHDDRLSKIATEIWPSGWKSIIESCGDYRILGGVTVQKQQPGQYLSYLCFHPEFIEQAIEMGRADAHAMIGDATSIPWDCL